MRKVLILLCLWAMMVTAGGAPTAAGVQVVLELSDGSRIVGTPLADHLKLATPYSTMEIPLAALRAIELSGTGQGTLHLKFRNGDSMSGQSDVAAVGMKAIFGQVTIPLYELRRIQVTDTGIGMPDGLVLHYTFDKDEGGRVTDSSGAGNDGKVIGATYTGEGKVGRALSFSGDRQAVVIGNPASLQLQNFTIMAWVKRGDLERASLVNADGGNGLLFGYGHGGYAFAIHPNGGLYLCKPDFDTLESPYAIDDDSFHQVAVTKQGSRVVFYMDGTASTEINYNDTFEFGTNVGVGAKVENMANTFIGVIDELSVFNRALSGEEVKGIYDSEK